MSTQVIEATSANFEAEVVQSDKPVLVDFWASWCGPCKAIAPMVEELAGKRDDIKVVKVEADQQGDIAARYSIRSLPTLMVFKDGAPVGTRMGSLRASELSAFVDENI